MSAELRYETLTVIGTDGVPHIIHSDGEGIAAIVDCLKRLEELEKDLDRMTFRETKGLARHHREASGAGMRRHTRKAWRGGKPPEINAEGKAALAHAEQCEKCKAETLLMTTCEEGKRLFAAFNTSLGSKP